MTKRGKYKVVRCKPVDMFPATEHVEVVSLLQKMSNTREKMITLDVEMEDYHRIKNRTEVTADATE
jgi:23S rRNA (uracil1939-C5)-methyltransferase